MVPGKGSLAISRMGRRSWLPGLASSHTGSQPGGQEAESHEGEGGLRSAFGWTRASPVPTPCSSPCNRSWASQGWRIAWLHVALFSYRIRMSGIKGLQGVVRKTVNDELQANIWDPQHMDKIVPSLLFNLQHIEEAER